MKFNLEPRGSFEITGITKIVHNTIMRKKGEKIRIADTYVWELAHTKKGLRWLKYEWGKLAGVNSKEELRAAILDGASQVHMHNSIVEAMEDESVRVWFSGNTCNIEVDKTFNKAKRQKEIKDISKELGNLLISFGEVLQRGEGE